MEPCISPPKTTGDAEVLAVFDEHCAALKQFFSTKALIDASRCLATAARLLRAGGYSEKEIRVEVPRLRRALAPLIMCVR